MNPSEFHAWLRNPRRPPLVMGVLNVTPDSFSDGNRHAAPEAAIARAQQLAADGADILDLGGESTRPGSQRVDADEQIRRLAPVFEGLAGQPPALLSIDTTRAAVARFAIEHGASLVNDISAATDDPAILPLCAQTRTPLILMHMRGQPATMQLNPTYDDVVADIQAHLRARLEAAQTAGIPREHLLVDPGIGFGKTLQHNLALLRDQARLLELGSPLVIGASRKGFIGKITGESEPSHRLFGTAAAVAWSIAQGASIVRVHDVAEMTKVVRLTRAIQLGTWPPP